MTDTKKTSKTMNRRELLKALAATGGAVTAATMLPGKWAKPVIEAGVLPAHAATSVTYTLATAILSSGRGISITGNGNGPGEFVVEVTMDPAEAGVEIVDQITGDFSGGGNTKTTDSDGKVSYFYRMCSFLAETNVQGCDTYDFIVTFSFVDKDTFGTNTASLSITLDSCQCN